MKYFDWDEGKNLRLKIERGIGFEDVVAAIDEGRALDEFDHPNQKLYPNQRILVVEIADYAYYVPYVEDEEKIFLKTIIPSRKATKKYILGGRKK